MKQSTLSFAAAKRTASNSYSQAGKLKSSAAKKAQPVTKAITKKRESSEDGIDDYDDIVIKSSSGEEIEEVEAVDSTPSRVDPTEVKDISSVDSDNEPLARKTRLQRKKSLPSKPGIEKASNAEPFKTSNLKPEALQKRVDPNECPELDPSSKKWTKLHKTAKAKLGGVPVHGTDNNNKVQQILQVFDNSYEYGPCVGMTRLERWERAESLGLNPPKEVYEILMTKQGQTLDEYKQSVFHGQV